MASTANTEIGMFVVLCLENVLTTRRIRIESGINSQVFLLLYKNHNNTATFWSEPDLLQATLHKCIQQWASATRGNLTLFSLLKFY